MHSQTNETAVYRLVVAALYTGFGVGAGVFYTIHEYGVMLIFLALSALTALTWRTQKPGEHKYDWDDYYAGRFPPRNS